MIAGLYQLWKQLVRDGNTNLTFLDWKDEYFKKVKKRIKHIKKPRKKGLQKWLK